MSNPKVSVIIPVYKAENYLHKCLNSLLVQTLTDFEILLIDDGSPDNSCVICDTYAATDSRIRVFHQTNCGVSTTRQHGLNLAVGEYVIHVDPDDWVEPDMLQALYTKAISEDVDMVICDFYVNYAERQEYVVQKPDDLNHNTVLRNLFQKLHGSCWNKLVRRSCYTEYQVKFDSELSFCEDLYCNASLLTFPLKIAYLPQAFYHYEQTANPNSLANNYNEKSFGYDVKLRKKFLSLLQGTEIFPVCNNRLCFLILSRAYQGRCFSSKEFRKRCLPYCREAIKGSSGFIQKAQFFIACHGFYALSLHLFPTIIRIRLLLLKKKNNK